MRITNLLFSVEVCHDFNFFELLFFLVESKKNTKLRGRISKYPNKL